MAIRKSNDIGNETNSKFNKSKSAEKLAMITERFDDTTDNDNPYDDALQYMNKKVDECIDAVNTNSNKTVLTIGTGSGNAKAGNTTTITSDQTKAITANTAKTGITSDQTKAITANTAKKGVSDAQASLLGNLGKGITVKDISLSFEKDRSNNLIITDGTSKWVIAAAR